jgi:hypothetical protein
VDRAPVIAPLRIEQLFSDEGLDVTFVDQDSDTAESSAPSLARWRRTRPAESEGARAEGLSGRSAAFMSRLYARACSA